MAIDHDGAARALSLDEGRCSGRFDFDADNTRWCDRKDSCKRYLSFVYWDRYIVDCYKGISVSMAVQDCQRIIEVTHE